MSDKTISTPAASAKGDDRNLVPVDPANALTFEEQALLIWKKQRTFIIGTLVAVVAVLIGWFSFQGLQQSRENALRQEFGAATTLEARRAFATAHPEHPLSGLALLALADDSYAAGRYEEAARDYAAAAKVLSDPLLVGRARMGEGAANLKSTQGSLGEQQLTALAEDATMLMAHRAQAWYILAAHAAGQGDADKARDTIGRLKALDPEGEWASLATALQTRLDAESSRMSFDIQSQPPAPEATPAVETPPAPETPAPAPEAATPAP